MLASVLSSTIQAATAGVISANVAALTEGVMKAMLLTKLRTATLILLAVCVVGVSAGILTHHALADKPTARPVKEEENRESTEVRGTVKAVSAADNSITLQRGKGFDETTYKVVRDVRVLIDDGTGRRTGFRDGKLADLTEGAVATLRLSGEQQAFIIYVEGPNLTGILKGVDAAARTISVTVPDPMNK